MILRYTLLFLCALFVGKAAGSSEGAWVIDLNDPLLWAAANEQDAESQISDYGQAIKAHEQAELQYYAENDQDKDQRSAEYVQALEAYEQAKAALDEERWDDAAKRFDEVAKLKSRYEDASMYWLAYAYAKMGRTSQALKELEKFYADAYSSSRWRKDARALEVEIRQGLGQNISPDAQDDEELKLIVIEGLMHTNSERAVPMLKKILEGNNSPDLKERAMFVLSQSGSPEAHQIIANYARGADDPELQMKAIQNIALFSGDDKGVLLKDIYGSTSDRDVKKKVLESYLLTGDSDNLLQVARTESSPELRSKAVSVLGLMGRDDALWELYQSEGSTDVREKIIESFMISGSADRLQDIAKSDADRDLRMKAIQQLGLVDGEAELWDLYQTEKDVDIREKILEGLWLGGNTDKLIQVARTEPDVDLRAEAIQKLGLTGSEKARSEIADLYMQETDREVKESILSAMFLQHNVDGLIEIARTEKDRELRKDAIQKLSIMGDDRATDFLLELLDE
jgi:tetratricopeptide (TPR) repeat protein